jgi:hypothetical protein
MTINSYGTLQKTIESVYGIDKDILNNEIFERDHSCICMDDW